MCFSGSTAWTSRRIADFKRYPSWYSAQGLKDLGPAGIEDAGFYAEALVRESALADVVCRGEGLKCF